MSSRLTCCCLVEGATGALANRDEVGAGASKIEDRAGGQIVIEHNVGLAQPRGSFQRQQLGIAGTCGNEGHEPAHRSSAIKWKKVPEVLSRREPVSATTAPVASRTTASGASGWARIVE